MDELAAALSESSVSTDANSITREHPHFAQYKITKASKLSQEERRKKFLEAQKNKRFDYVSHARQLATGDFDCSQEKFENDSGDDMECDLRPEKSYTFHKNQLMLSEWMVEVPDDLDDSWLLVLCPVGKRTLIISSAGSTRVYARNGHKLASFPSALPGGNRRGRGTNSFGFTILDCIFVERHKTFYVLDLMSWNGHSIYDSDSEFRLYWVQTKFSEDPSATKESSINPFKFIPLPNHSCDKETLHKVLWSPLPFDCQLDGLLFFHKRAHYIPKQTPLMGWLKGYMVPEILNIDVPESLCTDRPSSYTTMKEQLPKAFEKHEKRKDKEQKTMDCADNEESGGSDYEET